MATYEWFTEADSHVCATCRALDGVQFSDLDSTADAPYPAHTGCRCTLLPVGTAAYDRALVARELRRQIDAANPHKTPFERHP